MGVNGLRSGLLRSGGNPRQLLDEGDGSSKACLDDGVQTKRKRDDDTEKGVSRAPKGAYVQPAQTIPRTMARREGVEMKG